MHFKAAVQFALGAILATGVVSTPLPLESRNAAFNFNGWGGFASLNGFDDFFGVDNVFGLKNQQFFLQDQLFCAAQPIHLVQQQLLIVQELAKKMILEQICEVEAQAFLIQQLTGGFDVFANDLLLFNGRKAGFDKNIVQFAPQLFDVNGAFAVKDFGFNGHNLGQNLLFVGGSNFVDGHSQVSVKSAFDAVGAAKLQLLQGAPVFL